MAVSYFYLNQCLKKVQLLRHKFLQQRLKSLGIHPSQLPILNYIRENSGCTQVEISKDLTLTPAAIALATKRLQKLGLLQKKADEQNLRQNSLTLTERGETLCQETREIFAEFDRKMFRGLSEEELEQFRRCLDRMAMNITGEETNVVNAEVMTDLLRQVTANETVYES